MNWIEKMIAEQCPNGEVEWKTLGKVCNVVRGASPRPISNFLTFNDGTPWIKIGDVGTEAKYVTQTNEFITSEGVKKSRFLRRGSFILSNSMSFGRPYILKIDGCIHDGWIALSDYENTLCSDYLYELLKSKKVQYYWRKKVNNGGAMSNLNSDIVSGTPIPIPPLSIQKEIVRVLDKFSELIEKTDEEIALRQKQYEYYREKLLTFEDGEKRYIEDCIEYLKTGLNPRTNFKLNTPDSILPYVTGKDIFNNRIEITDKTDKITIEAEILINRRANIEVGNILFASTGTGTVGRMAYVEKYNHDWNISETLYNIKVKDFIYARFFMHYLNSYNARSQYEGKISKGSVPHLKISDLMRVKIPLPSLSRQQEIVATLDKFEALISKLKEERELRQKQYEYYRDNLLTF